MKKLLYTFTMLLIAGDAMSQAITLNSSPTINTSKIDSCGIPSSLATLPSIAPATNASWDFGTTALQATPFTYQYRTKTPGFSTASFADSNTYNLSVSAGIGFKVWRNIAQGSSGVTVVGEEVLTRQAKSLSPITGNSLDSFIIPTQVIAFSTPLPIIKFPATMSSAWAATTPRTVNFNITATAFGLNNAPGQVKEIRSHLDSVVGWGRMKVPVIGKSKSSSYIPVLQVRHRDVAIDSFYLNGSLAPAAVVSALGLTQGQRTVTSSTYFYRAAAFRPLLEGLHLDSNFSTSLSRVYLHAVDLPEDVSVPSLSSGTVRIYPNPLTKGPLHVEMANVKEGWSYALMNVAGQQVANGDLSANLSTIALPEHLNSGIYYLQLEHASGESLIMPLEIE